MLDIVSCKPFDKERAAGLIHHYLDFESWHCRYLYRRDPRLHDVLDAEIGFIQLPDDEDYEEEMIDGML